MNYLEALDIFEVDDEVDFDLLKQQYRWFIRYYHPDNLNTGSALELKKRIKAYSIIRKKRGFE